MLGRSEAVDEEDGRSDVDDSAETLGREESDGASEELGRAEVLGKVPCTWENNRSENNIITIVKLVEDLG